ncbi:MAG: heavy metal translocating P-type ATPase [Pseudomonadota bacterium]
MTDQSLDFALSGLNCGACVGRAEAALRALPGAQDVRVNLAQRRAHIAGVDADAVMHALSQAGYPAAPRGAMYQVPDMHCGSCVSRVETAASDVVGVISAQANLATRTLQIETLGPLAAIEAVLRDTGFPLHEATGGQSDAAHDAEIESLALRRRFLIAGALTLPVFLTEMGGHLYPPLHHTLVTLFGMSGLMWAQMVLTLLVLAGPGRSFFRRGLPGLFKGRPDMDALVALGAGAAFLYSTAVVLAPGLLTARAVYFEAAAVIVTLILLGKWLEARARGRTGDAVRALLQLAPDTAERETEDGTETVPIEAVVAGDIIHAHPGARIAVDGIVRHGQSPVDTAMLTGEPIPQMVGPGDRLAAGSLLTTGSLVYEATHVGRDTTLARIAALTEAAQSARLPVEELANKITRYFVPVVLLIALMTFVVWVCLAPLGSAVIAAVSVLIIACPCAMGLATPMSIMVGTGRAAQMGALFHKGAALQQLQDVRVVAFDKTGTLTVGAPTVTEINTLIDHNRTLQLVAAVEAKSEHPIARALTAAWDGDVPEITKFNATPGAGAAATVDGTRVCIGNLSFITEHATANGTLTESADLWAKTGATPVHVAVDGEHVAAIAVADRIRDGASDVIAALNASGRKVALISGDVPAAAEHVAATLGIDIVVAGVKPAGKVQALDQLRQLHGPVAFVGDGINDAPALAAADVGLSVGGATDIAVEAADVVLMSPEPSAVLRALGISRATLRNVWQNLFWAFAYNAALIPVAAGVLVPFGGPQLSPQLAALAMACSSLFVVANALRLRSWSQA